MYRLLQINFLGEEAEDGGGPRREFWRLLSQEMQASIFEGALDRCIIRHDAVALKVSIKLLSSITYHSYTSKIHHMHNDAVYYVNFTNNYECIVIVFVWYRSGDFFMLGS